MVGTAPASGRATAAGKGSGCPSPAGAGDRPPVAGEPAVLAGSGRDATSSAAFTATYRDETYLFCPGSWARFGRDDTSTHITVWEELLGTALSRVAGEVWCVDDEEMWVRNLSTTHELLVAGADGRPQLLGPRRDGQRGRACSVPVPAGVLSAPSTGGWEITVRRTARPAATAVATAVADPGRTRSVGPVPADLLAVAAALCAPLLAGAGPPASYEQIADVLGLTARQARRRVDRLCEHYRERVPDLVPAAGGGQALYAPVAALLVDRGRVTRDDLALLARGAPSGPA